MHIIAVSNILPALSPEEGADSIRNTNNVPILVMREEEDTGGDENPKPEVPSESNNGNTEVV